MSTRRKKPDLRRLTVFMLSMVLLNSFSANTGEISGLQLSCKLDEGIGNVAGDSSGNGHTGSVSGATWTTGKINGGLSFDGIDDHVQIPGLLGQPQNVTISAWANLHEKDAGGAEVISVGDYVAIRLDGKHGQEGVRGFYYDGTTWRSTPTGIMAAGTGWHHFVYVVDNTHNMQKVYIDGIEKGSTAHPGSISYTGLGSHTFLGRHGNGVGNYDFNGVIDDVRLYNWALNEQEVQDIYNTAENPIPPDPATVAPPLDLTVVTTLGSATAFLYTGENPIQTGVGTDTIKAYRCAVLRGKALDRDNNPLPGVTITILDHPEFGQTMSRLDGMFDMAVNGGGLLRKIQ